MRSERQIIKQIFSLNLSYFFFLSACDEEAEIRKQVHQRFEKNHLVKSSRLLVNFIHLNSIKTKKLNSNDAYNKKKSVVPLIY